MTTPLNEHADIVIVDPHPEHYHRVLESVDGRVTTSLCITGQHALESLPRFADAAWLLNVALPDVAGADLLLMIRQRRPGAPVTLVADVYSADQELAARKVGATAFLCKPVEASWICQRRRRASLHTAPIRGPS